MGQLELECGQAAKEIIIPGNPGCCGLAMASKGKCQ